MKMAADPGERKFGLGSGRTNPLPQWGAKAYLLRARSFASSGEPRGLSLPLASWSRF